MAKFMVTDYIDIGSGGPHGATSWKVWKDKEKTILLDESLFDEKNVEYWHSPLAKEDGSGFYSDLEGFYVEIILHFNIRPGVKDSGHPSDPFTYGPMSQRDELIKITDGNDISYKTAKKLGWFKE